MRSDTLLSRGLGSYLGLAVGDALGATVEFMTASEIAHRHGIHQDITGGGWLKLPAGSVTDDTQMAMALGKALLEMGNEWDLTRIADAFLLWMHSRPVDIGQTVRRGLRRYQLEHTLEAKPNAADAGNGGAMRNLPVVLATLDSPERRDKWSLAQTHVTHHHPLSDAGVLALAGMTHALLLGGTRTDVEILALSLVERHPEFRFSPWPGNASGYIVDTLQTVLEAFFTTDSFETCLVKTINRGGDADTTGALAGQLAGAYYGQEAIPLRWLRKLNPEVRSVIEYQTLGLLKFL